MTGITVTSIMEGDHCVQISNILNRVANATFVDVYENIATVADQRLASIKCTLEVERSSIMT